MELIRSDLNAQISEIIDKNQQLVYLNDDDSVEKAMEWLLKYNLMILPVLDHNQILIGITSTNDLVNEFGKEWDLI
jgi:Mg/Co/Ni transporter MgtE